MWWIFSELASHQVWLLIEIGSPWNLWPSEWNREQTQLWKSWGLKLPAVAGLVHTTGLLDLGSVGQALSQGLELIGSAGGMVGAGISAAKKMVTTGPIADLNYLTKMADLALHDEASVQQAQASPASSVDVEG